MKKLRTISKLIKKWNNNIVNARDQRLYSYLIEKVSKLYPMLSLRTYISALSPNSNKLFHRLKYKEFRANEKIWYGPGHIFQNNLDSFITKLCEKMGMKDKGYSNQSLTVSVITNFSNKQKCRNSCDISEGECRTKVTDGFNPRRYPSTHTSKSRNY